MSTPRKQNIACDACRTRKVKCNPVAGEDRCQHCISKNYPCTHHAQQETEKKRSVSGRRVRNSAGPGQGVPPIPSTSAHVLDDPGYSPNARHYALGLPPSNFAFAPQPGGSPNAHFDPMLFNPSFDRARMMPGVPPPPHPTYCPPGAQYPYPGLPPPPDAPMADFLAYMFSPDPTHFMTPDALGSGKHSRARLLDPAYRIEFATELLEVYFQVYHPRVPIVNPTRFRAQFRASLYGTPAISSPSSITLHAPTGSPSSVAAEMSFQRGGREGSVSSNTSAGASGPQVATKPIHRPLLATLLAWGSKFSDHPLLVLDRQQSQSPDPLHSPSNGAAPEQKSRISKLLVDRAREVAEQDKVFRVAKPENVIVCILLEPLQPLQSYPTSDPQGVKLIWLGAAIRHLLEMQVNRHPSRVQPERDQEDWNSMVFCWWIILVVDALCCSYFKKKPTLSEDDYDLNEFKRISLPSDESPETSSKARTEFMRWYGSLHDLAICSRLMARTLWIPSTEAHGVPFEVLESLVLSLRKWRDDHLGLVGVTSDLQSHGDYVSAVGACTSDCSYHVLWIILSQAIEEYGIRHVNEVARRTSAEAGVPAELNHMMDLERAVASEAVESATRIAGLAGVLTSNGYMRLDPNAMHWPIYCAGRLLARLGRQEVMNCIDGLTQNGFAYEESWAHAKELRELYHNASKSSAIVEARLPMHAYEFDRRASASPSSSTASRGLKRTSSMSVFSMYEANTAPQENEDEEEHDHDGSYRYRAGPPRTPMVDSNLANPPSNGTAKPEAGVRQGFVPMES